MYILMLGSPKQWNISIQSLFTHAFHEVSQDALDRSPRERCVVLRHVNRHIVDVHRLLIRYTRVVLTIRIAMAVLVLSKIKFNHRWICLIIVVLICSCLKTIRPAHCLLFLDSGCKSTAFSNTIPEKAQPQQILKTQAAQKEQLA